MWRCPTCGQTFVTRNMPHSCEVVAVDDHFAKAPHLRPVFDAYVAAAGQGVTVNATKSRISIQTRMRFAAVMRPRRDHLLVHLVLTRPLESERFEQVELVPPYYYVHRLKLRTPQDVDEELRGWLAEAREVGDQRHVNDPDWKKVRPEV
jgi:hypothetical protein